MTRQRVSSPWRRAPGRDGWYWSLTRNIVTLGSGGFGLPADRMFSLYAALVDKEGRRGRAAALRAW